MDKAAFLERARAAGLPQDDVDVPGIGTVRVRALSRAEALTLPDGWEKEAHVLAIGIVSPSFSVSEIKALLGETAAGVLQAASIRIAELSGMLEETPKAAYKSDGDGTGAGV